MLDDPVYLHTREGQIEVARALFNSGSVPGLTTAHFTFYVMQWLSGRDPHTCCNGNFKPESEQAMVAYVQKHVDAYIADREAQIAAAEAQQRAEAASRKQRRRKTP